MMLSRITAFVCLLLSTAVLAQDSPSRESSGDSPVRPLFAVSASYPLVVSATLGAVYPPGTTNGGPASFGIRGEVEAGLGGGIVALGPEFRFATNGAFAIETAVLRTWWLSWVQPRDTTYAGAIFKYDLIGHGFLKFGFGYFRGTSGSRDTTILGSVGFGL